MYASRLTCLRPRVVGRREVGRVKERRRRGVTRGLDVPEFEVPEVEGSVEYYQRELGAVFEPDGRLMRFEGSGVRLTEDKKCFVYDRGHWGRFRIVGTGALDFLHNKTTNAFTNLRPGEGCDTLFCTAKGRIEDLATAYVQREAVFVIVSPEMQDTLVGDLEKFVFPGDRAEFEDMRSKTRIFSLSGVQSRELLSLLKADESVLDGAYGKHHVLGFNEAPVIVAKGNELDRTNGYTLIVEDAVSGELYRNLIDAGAVPIGMEEWETLRIVQGRPNLRPELRQALNPFEVDLFHAISLDKGCFLGQESIARVYTRDAIRKRLWGIQFSISASDISIGDIIYSGDREVGSISSRPVRHPKLDAYLGLGFLNSKVNKQPIHWEGHEVCVGVHSGTVVQLPYMTFDFIDGQGAPQSTTPDSSPTDPKDQDKEERLKAMQERLAAFMEQQQKRQ